VDSTSIYVISPTKQQRKEEVPGMPDELDLVRSYRSDIPGPSTDAWARARAALAEASGSSPSRPDDKARGRRRRRMTIGAIGAVSGVAALVSALALGGSAPAFAGWRSAPSYPTAQQTAVTRASCRPDLPEALADGTWSELATDVRGPYTMAVYESGTTLASCLIGPSFTSVQAESLTSDRSMVSAAAGPIARPPAENLLSGGEIEQLVVSHFSQSGSPYTVAEGRLDGGTVSAVTLFLKDGEAVTATTGNGWLVAWWPGDGIPISAQVTSANGTTTSALGRAASPKPPLSSGKSSPRMANVTPIRVPTGESPGR
jgi:hypothetical protein